MNIKQRLLRWAVVLGVTAALVTGCGDADSSPAGTDATAASPSAQTDATTAATPRPTNTTLPTTSPESTPSPVLPATAASTAEPGGATTAPACPNDEFPAVGALGIADGAVEWLVCSPEEAFRTVIGANADVVLIEESGPIDASGSRSQHTIAFDAVDGSERWRRSTGDTFIPPGPIDGQGIVVLADQDAGALVGVDVMTGEEQWRVESSDGLLANSPTVAVVWDMASQVTPVGFRGIDRATGDELWVSDTLLSDQSGNFVGRSPAAVLDEVLAVPTGATLTAIDMRTGAVLWEAPQLDDPDAADGTIVGARGSHSPSTSITITAIDAASGDERWTAPGAPSYGDLLAVGDGVIVVMDAGENRGLDLIAYELSSGNERWRATQTSHLAQPQLIDGTSLIMLWEGQLSVRSTTDGTTIWAVTQPFGSPQMNGVGSNGDTVFVTINSRPWTD